jgi:hypothetical protein
MTTPPDAAAVLARLAAKQGIALPRREDDFRVLLGSAACTLAPDREYTEREVNDALRVWIDGAGSMLATDHVEIRRWLVDTGLVERDGFGRRYRRVAPPPARFADALQALDGLDAAAVVAKARTDDAERRRSRRAQHEARAKGPA